MVRKTDFDETVPLPPGPTVTAIRKAIEYIERGLIDLVEIYIEQANVFSALVGIYGAKALDANSVYAKSRNLDIAQQRFPDLRRRGSGQRPSAEESLEDVIRVRQASDYLESRRGLSSTRRLEI